MVQGFQLQSLSPDSYGALAKFTAPVIRSGCRPIDIARRIAAAVADPDLVAGQPRLKLPIPAPLACRVAASPRGLWVGQRLGGQEWSLSLRRASGEHADRQSGAGFTTVAPDTRATAARRSRWSTPVIYVQASAASALLSQICRGRDNGRGWTSDDAICASRRDKIPSPTRANSRSSTMFLARPRTLPGLRRSRAAATAGCRPPTPASSICWSGATATARSIPAKC